MRLSLIRIAACMIVLLGTGVPEMTVSVAEAQVFTQPRPAPRPTPRPQRPTPRRQAPQPAPPPVAVPEPVIEQYADPVAYCAAFPDVTMPADPYAGPAVPDWISHAMYAYGTPGQRSNAMTGLTWRCLGGKVLACSSAEGGGACLQPVDRQTASPAIVAYCATRRRGDIPRNVIGNTLQTWACERRQPVITGYRTDLDSAGFLEPNWVDVTDWAPGRIVGDVPGNYPGRWRIYGRSGTLLEFDYDILIDIRGGNMVTPIGTIDYYRINNRNPSNPTQLCATQFYLSGYASGGLLASETTTQAQGRRSSCPVSGQLFLQVRADRLWLEWRRPRDGRVMMSGWASRQ
jgi:hypothetical protein